MNTRIQNAKDAFYSGMPLSERLNAAIELRKAIDAPIKKGELITPITR